MTCRINILKSYNQYMIHVEYDCMEKATNLLVHVKVVQILTWKLQPS